jgi:hypothetical protein
MCKHALFKQGHHKLQVKFGEKLLRGISSEQSLYTWEFLFFGGGGLGINNKNVKKNKTKPKKIRKNLF